MYAPRQNFKQEKKTLSILDGSAMRSTCFNLFQPVPVVPQKETPFENELESFCVWFLSLYDEWTVELVSN